MIVYELICTVSAQLAFMSASADNACRHCDDFETYATAFASRYLPLLLLCMLLLLLLCMLLLLLHCVRLLLLLLLLQSLLPLVVLLLLLPLLLTLSLKCCPLVSGVPVFQGPLHDMGIMDVGHYSA
jgi:hypothetical protein